LTGGKKYGSVSGLGGGNPKFLQHLGFPPQAEVGVVFTPATSICQYKSKKQRLQLFLKKSKIFGHFA